MTRPTRSAYQRRLRQAVPRAAGAAAVQTAPSAIDRRRRHLNDYMLLYLFTYDAEIQPEPFTVDTDGGQLRSMFVRAAETSVYSVLGQQTIPGLGASSISGRLDWGNDQLMLGTDDVARATIRAAILTEDGAHIDVSYDVTGYIGAGGTRRVTEHDHDSSFGNEDFPYEAPFVTAHRFETSHPRYRWLNAQQGIGFGKFQIVYSEFRRVTCDVYAIT